MSAVDRAKQMMAEGKRENDRLLAEREALERKLMTEPLPVNRSERIRSGINRATGKKQ